MSADATTDTVPELTLGEYITALIEALGDANPAAVARMRRVVGERRARISLDDEAVDVYFEDDRLHVQPAVDATGVNGRGETDSATVLALLDGYVEVEAAILNGRLRVFGPPDDTTRMFAAIEILLDASPRTPALQMLAARFRRERRGKHGLSVSNQRGVTWYPFGVRASEYELLAQLDLLPSELRAPINPI